MYVILAVYVICVMYQSNYVILYDHNNYNKRGIWHVFKDERIIFNFHVCTNKNGIGLRRAMSINRFSFA